MIVSLKTHHLLLFLICLPPNLHTGAGGTEQTQLSDRESPPLHSDPPNPVITNPLTTQEKDHLLSILLSQDVDSQGVMGEYSDLTLTWTEETRPPPPVPPVRSTSKPLPSKPTLGQAGTHQKTSTVKKQRKDGWMFPQQNQSTTSTFDGRDLNLKNSPASSRTKIGIMRTELTELTTRARRDGSDHQLPPGTPSMGAQEAASRNDKRQFSKSAGPVLPDVNMDVFVTSCKTLNQSWTPTDPNNFIPGESPRRPLALSAALLVPLYSDWNSALATWGLAWEAHVYGFGAIFAVFCLFSVVSLLALPLRCPPGTPYFTLLNLFVLSFSGTQAFSLIYDAYSSQDRLPPLVSLLLYELTLPILISSFSLVFLLLSFRSRMHLSLPLAISAPFSALPKPGVLLCMTMLHFVISIGCVGILHLFPSLPELILLFPHGVFVCFSTFLSFFFFIFYCLTQVHARQMFRLDDSGESGECGDVIQAVFPFSVGKDWDRAAATAVVTCLCLLGCGGLQLYGILHATGLGGADGHGFLPWPWWGYQVGCRLCESGVCVGLCLIATYPLFHQHKSSTKTVTNPCSGSWSRLSCSSPSRGLTLSPPGQNRSPTVTSHDSWSVEKQEKLTVCNVVAKGQNETLPLYPRVDPPENGIQNKTTPPRPTQPTPMERPHYTLEAPPSCLYVLDFDSTADLRPPSPIDLSRSIDQALFSESLFSQSIFGLSRDDHASSSLSLNSPSLTRSKRGGGGAGTLYRTSSCGNVDQEKNVSVSRPSQPHDNPPMSQGEWDWKGSVTGSTHGLCGRPKHTRKLRSNSWANRGQHLAQNSLPRALPRLSCYRRYRTLSLASHDGQGCGQLAGTKPLSESKQLEWDIAVQAEFVKVCRQIDALSICSDTIEL